MTPSNEEVYQARIAQLEAEVVRLREVLEVVKAERRELHERVYGPVPEKYRPTEEELVEVMRNHVPGSGERLMAELGINLSGSK